MSVVGRRAELAELRRRLPSERLLTLTGEPGCGTSTLAAAAAADQARLRQEPVRTVLVGDLDERSLVPAVATALGVVVDEVDADARDLLAALGGTNALLLLDGCERMLDACADLVDALLREAPGIRLLVTSRQVLGLPAEAVLRVGPLTLPEADHPRADQALGSDAVALFVDRAMEARRTFRLTDDNAPTVAAVCRMLEGNALAVVLAAARVSVLSPEDLLRRLEDRFRLLTKAPADAPERHRSLAASIGLTRELCTDEERLLWDRMTVFSGTASLEAAESVCGGAGLLEDDVLDLVDGLLEKGVLVRDESDPAQVRYRLPETLRTFGAAHLDEAEAGRLRDRHLSWCVDLADELRNRWFGPGQPDLARRCRNDWGTVMAALRHADGAAGRPDSLSQVVSGLSAMWVLLGRTAEGRSWLGRALAHTLPEGLRARAVVVAAWFAVLDDEAAQARLLLDEAAWLLGRLDPRPSVLDRVEGGLALREGRDDEARTLFHRAVETAVVEGDAQAEAVARYGLACAQWLAGEPDEAVASAVEARVLTENHHEHQLRARVLVLLGTAALRRGDLDEAEQLARSGLRLDAALGDRVRMPGTFDLLAGVAAAQGDGERAAALLGVPRERAAGPARPVDLLPPVVVQSLRAEAEQRATDLLGRRRYAARSAEAAQLSEDAALRFALGDVLQEPSRDAADTGSLTPRELAVAELVGRGLSNRDLGAELGISERTAQGHVQNILRKLGFTSRTQVAAWVADRQARARTD